ncbi:MAG: Holliday junction branch migration protein RuvA [Bdellovibrionales bacterium]|nr:Holliday junction branch migration protein RuvA [Bdellovibrionales bacterium]
MIGYLKGQILDHSDGLCLVAVGAAESRVGYHLHVPASAEYGVLERGRSAELHVYTHVREDALDLYGFLTVAEKELFLALLTVNGVGPRVALSVLSAAGTEAFVAAVLGDDKVFLTRIPGIGKKTAERLSLELSDPIQKRVAAGRLPRPGAVGSGSARKGSGASSRPGGAAWTDAVQALVGLGYREGDAEALLQQTLKDFGEAEPPRDWKAEEWIRAALKRVST